MEKVAYSVTEVALMLGISRSSAYEYVRTGELPSMRLGNRIVIPRLAFETMLDQQLAG